MRLVFPSDFSVNVVGRVSAILINVYARRMDFSVTKGHKSTMLACCNKQGYGTIYCNTIVR